MVEFKKSAYLKVHASSLPSVPSTWQLGRRRSEDSHWRNWPMKRKTSDIASPSGLKNVGLSGSHRRNPHQEKESASPVSSQEAGGICLTPRGQRQRLKRCGHKSRSSSSLQKPEEARNTVVRHTLRFRISALTSDIQPLYLWENKLLLS